MTCLAALCLIGAVAVDGDTIKELRPGRDHYVRIWGISAPEMRDPGGPKAKDAMAALIAGQTIACTKLASDKHRRTVALCRLPDGRDLACLQVAAGQAQDWPRYSRGAYAACDGVRPARRGAR